MIQRRSLLAALSSLAAAPAVLPALARTAHARPALSDENALWQSLILQDQSGRSFQLGDATAPVTLVAFWAHWCPGCVIEGPGLAALSQAMGSRLNVVLLSHPEWAAQDRATARQLRLGLPLVTPSPANSPDAVRAALLVGGAFHVPRTLAFRTRDAAVAWTQRGSTDWTSTGSINRVRALLG